MALQKFVIPKDYSITIEGTLRRLTADNGLIRAMQKHAYTYNHGYNSADWGGFDGALKALRKEGWTVNYSNKVLENIYDDVTENSFFIDADEFSASKHIAAIL